MSKFAGTKTEENLKFAMSGESLARNRYDFFAKIAEQSGLNQIADAFTKAALNEKYHARLWFDALNEIQSNKENLKTAVRNETFEAEEMYIEFARVANAEGFHDLAKKFEQVAAIEKLHEDKFTQLLEELTAGESNFKKMSPRPFRKFMECKYCGNITNTAIGSPCPVCGNTFEE